ncbi:CHAP domain-containing protein [Streptomyces noursei]|uniref:CHAP domain-containing protein n=1 Tax=Streptomyces noursei TaxID=1971 RepID=UPI00344EF95F
MVIAQMPLVIAVAKSQVGVHEGYSEGGWTNVTRYAAEVPSLAWADGQSWCATFTSWVAMRAGVANLFPRTADCSTGVAWFQAASRWSWYPAVGSQVFYGAGGSEHTGIVYAFDSTYIWTIEANTSVNGSSEGDGVYLRKRKRADAIVYGYGLPQYAEGVITADLSLRGLSGYTYAAAHTGPGPATLRQGAWMVDNLVTGSLAIDGPAYAGRLSIQQNDASTVAFEVIAASSTAPSIARFKDVNGNITFEVTSAGNPISRTTHYMTGALQLGSTTVDLGGGAGAIVSVKDASTAPTSNPTGGALLYSQGGVLKMRTSGGTVVDLSTGGSAPANFQPSDHGLTGWTFDPACCSTTGTTLSVGCIYFVEVVLRSAATISNLCATLGAGGSGLTPGQCLAALYTASGSRVGITNDLSTVWNTAGDKTLALTSSYGAAAGKYYIAFLVNGATSPTFACGSTLGNFTPGNAHLTPGNYRFCRSATGQTSLPPNYTMTSATPDTNCVWAAVA